jgi:CARDB protein
MRAHVNLLLGAGLVSAAAMAMPGWALAQPQPRQLLRPDLVIDSLEVGADIQPFVPGNQVLKRRRFEVCYRVRNIGRKASGAFRVKGDGLLPRPHQDHAGLAIGQSSGGCLQYSGIRVEGSRTLTLTVDSRNAVNESNERNNTASITVVVVPE